MNDRLDPAGEHAAEAARRWGTTAAEATGDDALATARDRAAVDGDVDGSGRLRRGPATLAAAAGLVLIVGIVGLLGIDRDGTDERLVPATQPTPAPTAPAPAETAPAGTAPAQTVPTETAPTETGVPASSDNSSRTFVVDTGVIEVQDTFVERAVNLDVGSGVGALGDGECDGCSPLRPIGPTWVRDDFVAIGDPANARVVIAPGYTADRTGRVGPDQFGVLYGDGSVDLVGRPIAGWSGDDLFVPVGRGTTSEQTDVRIDRWSLGDGTWTLVDSFGPEVTPAGSAPLDVFDDYALAGRSLVRGVPDGTGATLPESVYDADGDVPFVPIVEATPDGYTVIDEAGTETVWITSFVGTPSGLPDGSVVVAGAVEAGEAADAADPAPLLLRLWPDGTHHFARWTFDDAFGRGSLATERGIVSLTRTDDVTWTVETWPLPERARPPRSEPDEVIESCDVATQLVADPVFGYDFPWTVVGGPVGDNGVYVAIDDALGRRVMGGGCSTASNPPDPLSAWGTSYFTFGDSLIVVRAEPLSVGGVTDVPDWLGEPIASGVIDSLATEVVVFRVPDDRELPLADNDHTFLLVQVRGARQIFISSSGIGVYSPPEQLAPAVADPFDLQTRAAEFVQGYLDALAEGRWADAVTYISQDGRNWADRPEFADLFALVGEEVGTAAALERWCTRERDCTRGVANGVIEQVDESQAQVAITFEVPGGALFERTINPLWTVGVYEGQLYVDGLPQVIRR